jgi:uncharacterized Zn finger protein (UPF0148 family)
MGMGKKGCVECGSPPVQRIGGWVCSNPKCDFYSPPDEEVKAKVKKRSILIASARVITAAKRVVTADGAFLFDGFTSNKPEIVALIAAVQEYRKVEAGE